MSSDNVIKREILDNIFPSITMQVKKDLKVKTIFVSLPATYSNFCFEKSTNTSHLFTTIEILTCQE